MKALNCNLVGPLSVVTLLLLAMSLTSCTDNTITSQVDDDGTPELTGVRYVHPDSARSISKIGPGDQVALLGNNMDATTNVYFVGVEASFNPALMTDSSLIVTVPDIPFGSLDPDSEVLNTIRVANSRGESVLDFTVAPPRPVVNSISNEFAHDGETITIAGQYLYLIESITFPGGVEAEQYGTTPEGTRLTVTVPQNVNQGGGIEVATIGGQANTAPAAPFRSKEGMMANFDDVDNCACWSASVESDPSAFPQNWGNYARLMAEGVAGGDWTWWNAGRSVNIDSLQWIAPANLDDPVSAYSLKFEIYVKTALEHGTILIRSDDAWDYIARFEPWTDSGDPYQPDGWTTVSIPLTEFRSASEDGVDGAGDSVPSLTQLLEADGGAPLGFMYVNDDVDVTQDLNLAMDNIRVVKTAE